MLVVWSENLVEVKIPASEAMLEIQLETKFGMLMVYDTFRFSKCPITDVMQGAFSQSITEVHWGKTTLRTYRMKDDFNTPSFTLFCTFMFTFIAFMSIMYLHNPLLCVTQPSFLTWQLLNDLQPYM